MSMQNDFEILLDMPLDVDEAGVERGVERGVEAIIGDQDIRLILRENRIALAKGKTILIQPPEDAEPGLAYHDVPLICVVHSHPECRFRWARLMIDLSPTKGAKIRDMAPREVRGDKPVELKTSVSAGFKFETAAKVLSAEVKPEYTNSRTVYYPEIVSAGPNFTRGYWDFLALTSDYLHANRELRLLVSAQSGVPVQARFNLRAKVKFAGAMGLIPLLARSGEVNETYRLD
jgi:hypothetical protein